MTKDELLLTVLGRSDAPHLPLRKHQWAIDGVNVSASRRQALEELSVGVRLPASSGSESVFQQRLIAKLVDDDLLIVTRRPGERFPLLKLTEAAEHHYRSLAALPGLDDSLAWLAKLDELTEGDTRRWAWEGLLCEEYTVDEIRLVMEMALPSLVRSWAVAGSATSGASAYRLTDRGREALSADHDIPPDLPPWTQEGWATYIGALKARLQEIESTPPSDLQDIGDIPLGPEAFAQPPRASKRK